MRALSCNDFSEDLNIDDFMKSSPVGRSSPIQTTKHIAIQVCID